MDSRPPRVTWVAGTGAPVLASPLLVDDVLYAVDATGLVYAFDAASGSLRWRAGGVDARFGATWSGGSFGGPVLHTAPAVGGDLLFVSDTEYEGCVYVYDRHTGELLHKLPDGWPMVVGDLLLIVHLNDGVRALSLPDFAELWRSKGWTGWLEAPAAIADGIAFAALGYEGHHTHSGLCAFEFASGREVFQVGEDSEVCPLLAATDDDDDWDPDEEDEGPYDTLLFGAVHAVVADGLVWMPLRREHEDDALHEWAPWDNGEIVGLDPRTGERRWHFALDPRERSEITGAVTVTGGAVYFTAAHAGAPDDDDAVVGHRLHAVDIVTGRLRWTAQLPGVAVSSPVAAAGRLLVATSAGHVHAFEAATGQPAWTVESGHEIIDKYHLTEDTGAYYEEDGQAILVSDDMMYVRTGAGIVAFAL
jgi:outer membrane protein assembly factor BamB